MTHRRVASPPILIQASDPKLRRVEERLSFRLKKLIGDLPHVLAPSLDHLVGAGEQRQWHRMAKRPRGAQVDDELESGRLLYW